MNKRFWIKILLLNIVLLIILVIFLFSLLKNSFKSSESLKTILHKRFAACQIKQGTGCFKQLAKDLISQKIPLDEIYQVIRENETKSDFFSYCHTTLHFLGQEAYRQEGQVANALTKCSAVCFGGCYHGVLEGYLSDQKISFDDDQKLAAEVPKICKKDQLKNPELFHECLHGIGHALMYVTSNHLPRSLKLCDNLEGKQQQDWCYSGVFMENSTSSTNSDHPSQYVRTDDPIYPCPIIEQKYQPMCYTLQSFYYATLVNFDLEKHISFCQSIDSKYQLDCFNAVGQTRVGNTTEVSEMNDDCNQVAEDNFRRECIKGVAGALTSRYPGDFNQIIKFCNLIKSEDNSVCFSRLQQALRDWED